MKRDTYLNIFMIYFFHPTVWWMWTKFLVLMFWAGIFFTPNSLFSLWKYLECVTVAFNNCSILWNVFKRDNNPLRIVKSSRLSFPKSCCHHCEKVYHFSIGRPPALLETNTDPCEVSQLSIIRYFFVHVNSFDKYKLFPRTYYRYLKFVDSQ